MKKKMIMLLSFVMIILGVNISFAEEGEKTWKNASSWALASLEQSKEISLYPECFNNADLTVNITRAEFAEISVGVYESITGKRVDGTTNPFIDSNNSFVISAYELGIVEGVSDKLFAPLDDITREAVATMLERTYSIAVENEEDEIKKEKFSDDDEISDWAYEAVYKMAGKGYVKGTGEGFEPLSGCTREQALIMAQRLVSDVKGLTSNDETDTEKEKYVIAYIGGSLTEGGANWRSMVTQYVQSKMPDKKVIDYAAGIGGTCSDYGSVRYKENVLSKEPDLVFMDSAINDATFGTSNELVHQKYVESMIRQSLGCEKVSAIVFIYMPYPGEKTDKTYVAAEFSSTAKEKLAKHYNIPSVYIQDYLTYKYNQESNGTKYMDWLGNYYNKEGEGYNVHPKGAGYSLYGEAILNAFDEKGFENFIKPVEDKALFCSSEKDMLGSDYIYIYADDERVITEGNWKIYKSEKDHDVTGAVPNTKYYSYPFFEEGIWHTTEKGAKLKFTTNAKKIHISYISYSDGNGATVYVDGKKAGEVITKSSYNNMNYIKSIDVSKDGKEHNIEIVVNDFGYKFDIGAIIEEK